MKKYSFQILLLTWLFAISYSYSFAQCNPNDSVPFSVDSTHLTVWNGNKYVPFFVKGINLGAAIPGKFPGELDVTRQQYIRWIEQMREAGFNAIRLYTLHYPHFYEVLDSINDANPQKPIFIFQGVWLDEEPQIIHMTYMNSQQYLMKRFKIILIVYMAIILLRNARAKHGAITLLMFRNGIWVT